MPVTLGFIIALIIVSLIMGVMIGFGVQVAASQWELGPIPRAFLGGTFILIVSFAIAAEFRILKLLPLILLVYYLGTFQIGTRLGLAVGIQAPDDNDPPEEFWDLMNRYQ